MIKIYSMAQYYQDMISNYSDQLLVSQIYAFEQLVSKSSGEKKDQYQARLELLREERKKRNGNATRKVP